MADYIAEYADHLRYSGKADATMSTYLDILRRLDRRLPRGLAEANGAELRQAVSVYGRSPASRALARAAARAFFAWATGDDGPLEGINPARYIPPVKVPRRAPRPAETDQLDDILTRAREPYLTWFWLAAGAGLRCVEISRLDREHITATRIWVQGKGGKTGTVPTDVEVWEAVKDLPPGPVARTPDGTTRADRRQVMNRGNHHLQRTLGHVGVTMHRLRHWYGTEIYRARGEFVAQQALRHASPATTAIYAQVASEAMVQAVAALPLPRGRRVSSDAGAAGRAA